MFFHPFQITNLIRPRLQLTKERLVVDLRDGIDVMALYCEIGGASQLAGGKMDWMQLFPRSNYV